MKKAGIDAAMEDRAYYSIEVAGLRRELPLCRLNDELQIAAFVIFGDPELTVAAASALLEVAPEHDYMITAEAKGIPLIHEMARQSGNEKYMLARKGPKLYMPEVFEVEVDSITTAKKQRLCLSTDDADMMRGKRVLIVDDVISTGDSLRAMEALVDKAGGTVVGKLAILAEGDAMHRDDIVYLEKLPLFTNDGEAIW
jgi:adenine phosphoribosyltransferase